MTMKNLIDVEELKKDVGTSPDLFYSHNNRRYASAGHYYMPADSPEIHRLNEQHYILTATKEGALHNAPLPTDISGPLRILDVGCGSGIWCLEMAELYPEALIVGMDVSPVQSLANKPPNVQWVVGDMEEDWPFAEEYFQFIHLSLVHGCVANWEAMMRRIMSHLVPGGFIEHQEFSLCRQYTVSLSGKPDVMSENVVNLSPFFRWGHLMEEASLIRGRPIQLGPNLASYQRSTGLQEVTESIYRIPTGTWPDDPEQRAIGGRMMLSALQGMEGFTTVMFTKVLGWSLEDTKAFVEDVKRDLRDDGLRKVMDLYVVFGRKAVGGQSAEKKSCVQKG